MKKISSYTKKIFYWPRKKRTEKLHFAIGYFSFFIHCIELRVLKFFVKKYLRKKFIAIALIEHLGDIVACEPVTTFIRSKYPKAYIIWCVRKPYRELIDSNPHIDKTLVIYCLTEWIYLAKCKLFDEIIDLHFQGRVCPTCQIPLEKTKGDREITFDNYYNFGSILSVLSKSAGLPPLKAQPKLYIPHSVYKRIRVYNLPNEFIVIHCSSNEVCRDWSKSKWEELIKKMIEEMQLNVVEVGLVSAINNIKSPYFINFCGKLSILETAEVIRRAQLFIGVDSGPAQMANALGTFGVILLGHFCNFIRYIPYSGNYSNNKNVEIIYENGPIVNIAVETVYQAVQRNLKIENNKIEIYQSITK